MNQTPVRMTTFLSVLFVASVVTLAEATPPAEEGTPQFWIAPQLAESRGPLDPFTMIVSIGGIYYPSTVTGTGKLRPGKGLRCVSGDSVHVGHVSEAWKGARDNLWSIVFQAREMGSTEIRATLRIRATDDRIDEMEVRLPIEVDSTGIRAGISRTIRAETVRAGQRFRYGGSFLVPIDKPENITYVDIKKRARVVAAEDAICAECGGAERAVPFVVFVDPRGKIRSYRLLPWDRDGMDVSSAVVQSAGEALRQWKFSPASTRSRTVDDWIIVRVNVHR